jgi:D-beta-D-heptose 7-phosphate kinase/D-beta-D-heptose 1-phosphate adenosyltransferase
MTIGIVSGYFNPLHYGHVEYINAAKERSDRLICIVNSDYQVALKDSIPFMSEDHRAKILGNLKSIDEVFISIDKDRTQCESLKYLREKYPNDVLYFFNSGDRKGENLDLSESGVCEKLNIKLQILDLPKLYSSSDLLNKVKNK